MAAFYPSAGQRFGAISVSFQANCGQIPRFLMEINMEMAFVWLARLMYLGIFLLAGGMFYRVWKIAVSKDLRYVADWRGRGIVDPERWAPWVLSINFIAAGLLLGIGAAVLLVGLPFTVWTGAAGLVLWTYYFFLRVVVARSSRA